MLQRIFFVTSGSFIFSILFVFGAAVFSSFTGGAGWDTLFIRHTSVDIEFIQPSCLSIEEQTHGGLFEVKNTCPGNLQVSLNPPPGDPLSPEDALSLELLDKKSLFVSRPLLSIPFERWEIAGNVGNQNLSISGTTHGDTLYILLNIALLLIPMSFFVAITLGVLYAFQALWGRKNSVE